jgi:hypothetical protein
MCAEKAKKAVGRMIIFLICKILQYFNIFEALVNLAFHSLDYFLWTIPYFNCIISLLYNYFLKNALRN